MNRKTMFAVLMGALALGAAAPGIAQTQSGMNVKDSTGTSQTLCDVQSVVGTVLVQCADIYEQGAQVSSTNPLDVKLTALPAFAAPPTVNIGTAPSLTIGALPALPAGANTIGTVNFGTLNGAATAALQSTMITSLGSPFQAGGSIANAGFGITGTLPAFAAPPTVNIGTAPAITINNFPTTQQITGSVGITGALPAGTNALGSITNGAFGAKLQDATGNPFGTSGNPVFVSAGGGGASTTATYNSAPPTLTNTQAAPLQADVNGNLKVAVQGGATAALQSSMITNLGTPFQSGGSIGNTGFGITGTLPAFAAPPTFNIGTAPAIAINNFPTTQQVAGSVGITGALPAGTNALGSITNGAFGAKLQDAAGNPFGTSGNPVYVSGGGGGASTTTTYNSTAPTLSNGQTAPLQADVNGNLKVAIGTLPALSAGTNTIGTVLGPLPAAPITGQQTLTASAVALPANALQNGMIVTALPANAGTVYVGAAGVTATTGYPLAAGQSASFAVANSNSIFILDSVTTDKVAFIGN